MAKTFSHYSGWLRIKQACLYCSVSERTIRNWLKEGLRFSKVHGTVLISVENLDEFLKQFEVAVNTVDQIVDTVIRDFKPVSKPN